jgi:uncharacterized RDD family membrane protein YckC
MTFLIVIICISIWVLGWYLTCQAIYWMWSPVCDTEIDTESMILGARACGAFFWPILLIGAAGARLGHWAFEHITDGQSINDFFAVGRKASKIRNQYNK